MVVTRGGETLAHDPVPDGWSPVTLGGLMDFQNGVNAEKRAYGHGIRFVNVLEVITHTHLRATMIPGRVMLPRHAAESYVVRTGDVVFNRTSETQEDLGLSAVYVDDEPVVFGGFVIRGRPKGNRLDSRYAAYALRAPSVRQQIVANGQGAIRANIGQAALSKVVIALPGRAEQEAIADALGDMDALIESLEQLIAKKRQVTYSVMQEMLTGKRRLPGFATKPDSHLTELGVLPVDWSVSTVGREFSIQLGKMLDAEKNEGMPKPYLGNRSVQWGRIDLSDLGLMKMSRADLLRYGLQDGDLLVCEGGEVGRCAIWRAPVAECYYQKALHRVRSRGDYRVTLLRYVLEHHAHRGLLEYYVTKTSIAHLPKDKFETVPIPVPPTREERDGICAVLSDMEAELDAYGSKIAKARQLKSAMAHNLLTGKVRLV